MSGVNPYYSGRRSTPMSHFVDESLPSELMLKAGTSKQEQQNQIQSLVDQAGLWDLDNIGGGDKDLVKETREKVAEFVETNSKRNLTSSEAQRDVKNFITKLTTDSNLKQVTLNKKKVDQMDAQITALKAAGHQEFSPSVKAARRQVDEYKASGVRGGEFGKIDIEKALNLEAKERSYSDNLKPTADEELTYGIKNLPSGFIGKKGWKKLLPERIIKRAEDVSKSYALTSEGQQALALYREEILDYNQDVQTNPNKDEKDRPGINPNDVSADDYLVQRLTEAGLEYVQDDNQIGIQRSVFPSADTSSKPTKPTTPQANVIVEPGPSIPNKKIESMEDMVEELEDLKSSGGSQDKINSLQNRVDRSKIWANNTNEGKAIIGEVDRILTPTTNDKNDFIIQPIATDFAQHAAEAVQDHHGYTHAHADNGEIGTVPKLKDYTDAEISSSINDVTSNLMPIYEAISNYMPGLIKEEMGNKNLNFAKSLASSMPFYADYTVDDSTGKIIHGLRIQPDNDLRQGNGKFVPYTDMGVSEEDLEFLKKFEHEPNDAAAQARTADDVLGDGYTMRGRQRVHENANSNVRGANYGYTNMKARELPWVDYASDVDAYHYGALIDNAGGIYATDNDVYNDATDNLVKNLKDYYSLIDKGEGRQVVQSEQLLTFNKTFNDFTKQGFIQGNNLLNLEIVDPGKDGAVDVLSGEKLKKLSNVAPSNLTLGPLINSYGMQIGVNKGNKTDSFIVRPKVVNGKPQTNEKLDAIYNAYGTSIGRPNLAMEVKSESFFRDYATIKPQNINSVLGFRNPTFAPINGQQMTIRLNPNDSEVVGIKKGGVFTDDQVQSAQGRNPYILGIGGRDITYNQLQDQLDNLRSSADTDNRKQQIQMLDQKYFFKVAGENNLNLDQGAIKAAYIAKINQDADPNYKITDSKVQEDLTNILLARTNAVTATNYNDLAAYSVLMRTVIN